MKPIIEICVNKYWECEPFLNAMVNPKLRPAELPFPSELHSPKDKDNRMTIPRAVYDLKSCKVIVRCIEDLMDRSKNSSSSEEKYRVLPAVIAGDNPDYIISVSTAESVDTVPNNGSVFIGGTFFLFDGDPDNPESHLVIEKELFVSNISGDLFALFDSTFSNKVSEKLIPPVNYPAPKMTCTASAGYTSIGVQNVTDYSKYEKADKQAFEAFRKNNSPKKGMPVSIETTHGVVRMCSEKPVMFVSPITDRYGCFDEDVTDTQNYIAGFNAGIAVAEMLISLEAFFK
ncbi:MAG: hypothetical protein LBR47_02480 [Spirochaetaceae bacterium]|jgi:hypothetical protein|nr:hypothetical protein [Spirochaetaceae bacterium]